jgi:hypothetical protein
MSASPIANDQRTEEHIANNAKALVAELREARKQGLPFIVEWRHQANAEHAYASGTGCGCGPVD